MKVRESYIKGLVEIIPDIFEDSRGHFLETYKKNSFQEIGIDVSFVQDNQSYSIPNVIRGLHFQNEPFGQAKLVRVIKGKILDVAVDLRQDSPTFGKYQSVVLDSKQQNMFYIPVGFAHGFAALEESTVLYKCTNVYNKQSESGLIWNDPDIGIDWGVSNPIVSEKDQVLPSLKQLFQKKAS